jgi:hypothetical protein
MFWTLCRFYGRLCGARIFILSAPPSTLIPVRHSSRLEPGWDGQPSRCRSRQPRLAQVARRHRAPPEAPSKRFPAPPVPNLAAALDRSRQRDRRGPPGVPRRPCRLLRRSVSPGFRFPLAARASLAEYYRSAVGPRRHGHLTRDLPPLLSTRASPSAVVNVRIYRRRAAVFQHNRSFADLARFRASLSGMKDGR